MKNKIVGNETRPNISAPNIVSKMEPDQIESWETSINSWIEEVSSNRLGELGYGGQAQDELYGRQKSQNLSHLQFLLPDYSTSID